MKNYGDFLRSLFDFEVADENEYRLRERDLRDYQRFFADKIKEVPYCLLGLPMSTGKSATTLQAIKELLEEGRTKNVLIVAPLRVAATTWPDEIKDWEQFANLDYAVAVGTPEQREAAVLAMKPITIINRENLQWLWTFIGGKPGWRWSMLVYDESSRLKGFNLRTPGRKDANGNTKKRNFSEYGVLAMVRSKIDRVVLLSGTPSPNGIQDLGGQCYMLDQGVRLGNTKTAFLERFFITSRWSYKIEPQPFAEKIIMEKMSDVMFSLRAEDHIKLPDRTFHDVVVTLPPKVMKEYKEFEKSLYYEAHDIEAVSQGVLTNKAIQCANGSIYRTAEGVENSIRETIHLHDEKLRALESIIEEAAGANILIAYSFKFDLDRIRKRYPKIVVFDEEPNFKALWNAGKINLAIAHPASIGHGLNLQFGGHIQVWYGLTWSYELYDQFNWRLSRPGQSNPEGVFIYRIIAKGTADEDVVAAMETKGANQERVNEAVRVRVLNTMAEAA